MFFPGLKSLLRVQGLGGFIRLRCLRGLGASGKLDGRGRSERGRVYLWPSRASCRAWTRQLHLRPERLQGLLGLERLFGCIGFRVAHPDLRALTAEWRFSLPARKECNPLLGAWKRKREGLRCGVEGSAIFAKVFQIWGHAYLEAAIRATTLLFWQDNHGRFNAY